MSVQSSAPRPIVLSLNEALAFSRKPWWKGLNSVLIAASTMATGSVQAASFSVSKTGAWYDAATWSNGAIPGASKSDVLQVQATSAGVSLTVDSDPENFDPPFAYTVGTIQVSGSAAGSSVKILSGDYPVSLSVQKVNVATGAALIFDESAMIYADNLVLNGDGSQGRIELNGTILDVTDANFDTTDGSVTVAGGSVVFKDQSSYSGSTTLRAGKIILSGDGFGASSSLIIEGGILVSDPLTTESTGRTVSVPVTLKGDVQLGEAGTDTLSLAGGVDLAGGTRVLNVASTVEISSEISNGSGQEGAGKLVKTGEGKLILSAANVYSGGTELRAGILVAKIAGALGSSANEGPGGKLTVSGGIFELGAEQNISELEIKGGVMQADTDPNADLAAVGRVVIHGGRISADVATSASVSVVLADPTGSPASLEKKGAGTLTLNAENEYRGGTTLKAGNLVVGNDKALGTGLVTFAGGGLSANSSPKTLTNEFSVVGNGQVGTEGSGALTLAGPVSLEGAQAVVTIASETILAGEVKDGTNATTGGKLIKEGAAQLTLKQTNSYSGGTELRAGNITAQSDGALGTGGVVVSGGVLAVGNTTQTVKNLEIRGGAITGDLGGKISIQNPAGVEILAPVATSASVSASLGETAGKVGLRKTGGGALELRGANSYTGDTTIEAGEIRIASGAVGATSPLGAVGTGAGAVILAGGTLRVGGGGPAPISLEKEVRVVSSSQLISENSTLNLSKLSVAKGGVLSSRGNISANAIDISGQFVISDGTSLKAVSLVVGQGALFVWNKSNLTDAATAITLSSTAETDLSGAKVAFSKEFIAKALAATSTASTGQVTRSLNVGTLVSSQGSIKAPSEVLQPGGVIRFSLNTSDSKRVSLVLERSAYEQFATGRNGASFARMLDNAIPGTDLGAVRAKLDDLIKSESQAKGILRQADGGSTFSSICSSIPQQALAVSTTMETHLDDLGAAAGGGGGSMSMGVRVGAPSKETVTMSPVGNGEANDKNWTVWTSGYGSWTKVDADENSGQGKLRASGGGGALGLERQLGGIKAGILVSVGESTSSSDDPYLRVKTENWNLGGYGSMTIGAITLDASALWGNSDQDSRREVPGGDIASARYSTRNWQAGLGIMANLLPADSSWQISPVARLKYINSSEGAFEETGSALGIGSNPHNDQHALSKLGLRLEKSSHLTSSITLGVDGAAYWVHDYNSRGRDLQFQLGGASYTVHTRDRDADSTQFNLGLQATLSGSVTLRLSGQQDVSQDRNQTSGVFSVAYRF